MKLIHGGDVAGYEAEYGAKPLDFSANINPLGLPQGVRQAVIGALDSADAYPDPLCRKLRQAIARQEGLPMEQILCGNGAADLIFRLVLALRPKKALVTAPTFAEYEQALALVGCQVQRHMLLEKDDFQLMDRFLQQLHPGLDLVFLCNPNNPTGQVIRPALLDEIGERCGKMGIRLVVDECFQSFLDQPDRHTMKGKLEKDPMLFLLRAFTKFYAMAGIRLGYGLCADTQLLEQMAQCGQPWGVSSLAQAAGIAALQEKEYAQKTRVLIAKERGWLRQALAEQKQRVVGGKANYLFFQTDTPGLGQKMRRCGVMIRCCGNYPGLDDSWYRVAVRSHPENLRLIEALKQARSM